MRPLILGSFDTTGPAADYPRPAERFKHVAAVLSGCGGYLVCGLAANTNPLPSRVRTPSFAIRYMAL